MWCKFPYNENFVVFAKKHASGNGNLIINFAWPYIEYCNLIGFATSVVVAQVPCATGWWRQTGVLRVCYGLPTSSMVASAIFDLNL